MSLASRLERIEKLLADRHLEALSSCIVVRAPANRPADRLEAEWAGKLATYGLTPDTARQMGVLLIHRVTFCDGANVDVRTRFSR
jgi:hypothetical protein